MPISTIGRCNTSLFTARFSIATDNRKSGYTLLELIVVIAVIAISTILVLPRIPTTLLSGTSIEQEGNKLAQFIIDASYQAIRSPEQLQLVYSPTDNNISLLVSREQDDEETVESLSNYQLPDSIIIKNIESYYRGILHTSRMPLFFHRNGYIEPAHIHLQAENGEELTLRLAPFLGTITLIPGYIELKKSDFQ